MQHRRHAGLTTRLLALVAFAVTAIGIMAVTAGPAHAAGTWQNPGNWSFYNVDGTLLLAGKGKDPGLLAATSLYECNNGTNDDPNAGNGGTPSNYQDLNADFGSAPADAECASAVDDSEINTGLQSRNPVRVNGAVAAGGAITVASPGTNVIFPPIYQYTRATDNPLVGTVAGTTSVVLTATAASGNLDPATGVGTFNITLSVQITVPTLGACNAITVNLATTTGTSGSLTGSSYNPTTGLLTVVDNTFTVPALSGGLLGQCTSVNGPFGLPAAAGASSLRLVMRALPNPVGAQPTVTGVTGLPGSVTEGAQLALTPTATDANTTLCASPCTPPTPSPTYNWRWTQTAGPVLADETHITTPAVAGDLGILNGVNQSNGQARFTVRQPGSYSFRVEAGNGGSVNFGTAFTVSFTATAVNPTVNAGPDLTASANQAAATNAVKLTQTTTSPSPNDVSGRTYTWTKAGTSTCAGGDLTFTNAAAQNTTFSTGNPAADCFVDAVATTTVNAKSGSDTVRINVKATTSGQIKGSITGCAPGCAALASGTAFAFLQPGNTTVLSGPIVGGNYTITGATNGASYKMYFTGTGVTPAWMGGYTSSGNTVPVVAPYAGANDTLYGGTAANGKLDAVANILPSGTAANGTPVRLYNEAGKWVANAVTGNAPAVAGVAHFTGLTTGNYKVQFAPGSATYQSVWADSAQNVSTATPKAVTAGGATTTVTTTLALKGAPNADFQFAYDGGLPTAVANPTITDTTKAWTVNQFTGYKARIFGGQSSTANTGAQIRAVTSNTATAFTVSPSWTGPITVSSNYQLLPGRFLGNATGGSTTTLTDTGQAWTVNAMAGYKVKFLFGTGSGATATIVSNTATVLTFAAGTAPASGTGYQIIPLKTNGPGNISGYASVGRTGAALTSGSEARIYNAATGAFVGRVGLTGTASPTGAVSNFSFIKWTADPSAPNAQNGLAPGNYKVLLRVIGTGGGTPSFCSRWMPYQYTLASGGPAQGSYATAASFTVTAGAETAVSAPILQDAACQATN